MVLPDSEPLSFLSSTHIVFAKAPQVKSDCLVLNLTAKGCGFDMGCTIGQRRPPPDDKDLTLGRAGTLLNCPSHKGRWWDYMDMIREEETDAPFAHITAAAVPQKEFLDAIFD